jgi:hypothetical protein
MRKALLYWMVVIPLIAAPRFVHGGGKNTPPKVEFHTSDRCLACHNRLTAQTGEDVSIGLDWRASIMANSSRDPYWQGSVRRESIDHPESKAAIEDECTICHMPITRYEARQDGKKGEFFSHLPFVPEDKKNAKAEDGVTCSVCHQISKDKLGTRESFNGCFVIDPPTSKNARPENGPFPVPSKYQHIMDTSTGGFQPMQAAHIRDSALCGTCHTLYTKALGPGGKELAEFPEQMPYQEWLHSDYPKKNTCQECHMPEVPGPMHISSVLGDEHEGMRRHTFTGANFLMQRILNRYSQELAVEALPTELTSAADRTEKFLATETARVSFKTIETAGDRMNINVLVENLTGHKLPTAYPSRRAWLHVVVKDRDGHPIFESGKLNADGSIQGNVNDQDPTRFEPHFREITSADQVEIYEPILKDYNGKVTTGLLSTVGYLKDNRLLPTGFNKATADKDIAVVGEAADDPNFTDAGDLVRYSVPLAGAQGPLTVEAELWYQPIGYRWAHNLAAYKAGEPQRFVGYYDSMQPNSAVVLAKAQASR